MEQLSDYQTKDPWNVPYFHFIFVEIFGGVNSSAFIGWKYYKKSGKIIRENHEKRLKIYLSQMLATSPCASFMKLPLAGSVLIPGTTG